MRGDFEILGLAPGADKGQIKKAYFKLVRQHSPEKDPEGFQKIREAYERLMAENEEEQGPAFDLPDLPIVRLMVDQIEQARRTGRYTLARDTAQEAVDRFPGVEYFRYELVRCQRHTGNTGKAIKNATLLTEKDPENRWYWRELAIATLERGFQRKSVALFEKAYALGNRDVDFLLMYAVSCDMNDDLETEFAILLPLALEPGRWKRENMAEAKEVYGRLSELCRTQDLCPNEVIPPYCTFLKTHSRQVKEELEDWAAILAGYLQSQKTDRTLFSMAKETMARLREALSPAEAQENFLALQIVDVIQINTDERMCRSLRYRFEIWAAEIKDKFSRLDCELCMLAEREKIFAVEEILKTEYEDFYEGIRNWLDQVRDEGKAAARKYQLTRDYVKQLEYYDEGRYFAWFPEEKEKAFGSRIAGSDATYVRGGRKIGRNDPCPCGSGKKYKHCCMNTGRF